MKFKYDFSQMIDGLIAHGASVHPRFLAVDLARGADYSPAALDRMRKNKDIKLLTIQRLADCAGVSVKKAIDLAVVKEK